MSLEPLPSERDHDSWSTQQLVEFVGSIGSFTEAPAAMRGAVEAAAAALDAEVSAFVLGDEVRAAIGFRRGEAPTDELITLAKSGGGAIDVEGLGVCGAMSVPVEFGPGGWLLIGRFGEDHLSGEEQDLLRGMGRVLAMALGSVELLETLHERQALLERLSRLQRSIARRAELKDVFDAIVEGARELLGDEAIGLRLVAEDDPAQLELVSCVGLDPDTIARLRRSPVGDGAGGAAVERGELVVLEDYVNDDAAIRGLAEDGVLRAAMAAPIFERERIAGSLVVATSRAGRTYSASEREALTLFAEHAGLALNDARAAEETVHQAFHDSLTGLPNRARFLDRLEEVRSARQGVNAAVLFADLDGFKTVNDSLGHQAGDELLTLVAERLVNRLDDGVMVARFGGDEFAILLEDCADQGTAGRQADRVLAAFSDPFEVRGRDVNLSVSIGIAKGAMQTDHLMRNADLAMYQAKNRGKGRSEVFEPGMHTAVVERLELEADLARAIEREEILLHYQPLCRLNSGRIVGLEALARWQHPTRGLVQPTDFIPMAEESHQILALGRQVLREACRQIALWQVRYPSDPPLYMGVNVSGIQLEQPTLVEDVSAALQRADLAPESLVLEITETALMSDTEANVRKLKDLKELGVTLAVDDFGTGYSSLDYLRRFPIDVLKIAKSFVDDLGGEVADAPLVRAIIDLAHSFDLVVVAEGIEQPGQRSGLISLGCEMGQGFHFAEPGDSSRTDSLLMLAAARGADPQGQSRLILPPDGNRLS